MTNNKKTPVLLLILLFIYFFSALFPGQYKAQADFHTEEEKEYFKSNLRSPVAPGEFFLPSTSCRGCHGFDSAGVSNIDESGSDVNLVDHWESSMMAMSAKDPLWRAKVSHEILVNPAHALELQDNCTSCHAPLGRYTSLYHGNAHFGLAELATDTLGLDGVSCAACHAISPDVGSTFSGDIPLDTNHLEYGPFTNPRVGPMQLYEGLTPAFSAHTSESRICSSCHTLITQTADLNGNLTGAEFTEQATYHEYLNSNFPANNIKCQTCHMPQLTDPIIIANGFSGLTPRYPFNQHVFAGANFFMLDLIKNNKDSLGVNVPDIKFDTSIAATFRMLREKSININLFADSATVDTIYFTVKLENKAGHKFPSGYPSRRAVLQFVVTDSNNDTVFKSGMFDAQYRVTGENSAYEIHHNIISQSGVPQIYEMVMGDVNSNFTSVLERAAILLKDNRIPPAGFTSTSSVYDTVKISNDALADPDFNKVNSVEGSGIDEVHFHVSVAGVSGSLKVKTQLFYQPVPPKWLDEMFTLSSIEIDRFRTMYQQANQLPFAMVADSLENVQLITGIAGEISKDEINVWPTLSTDGRLFISTGENLKLKVVEIYNSEGQLVIRHSSLVNPPMTNDLMTIDLSNKSPGIYFLSIQTDIKTFYRKVIRL